MFNSNSRYFSLENATIKGTDGRTIAYKRRRFLPAREKFQVLTEVTVNEGDRMDHITARAIGDPEQFWRIADANIEDNPFDLTNEIGRKIKIPIPRM